MSSKRYPAIFVSLLFLPACNHSVDDPPPASDTPSVDEGIDPDDTGTNGSDSGIADEGPGTDGSEGEDSGDTGSGGTDSGDSGDTGGSESQDSGETDNSGEGDSGEETGSGDSETDDSGDGDTDTDPEPCQVSDTTVTPIPPNIMLVLDKSGSMSSESWDHDTDPTTADVTRWYSLHSAISTLTTNYEAQVKFGAKLFPEANATNQTCSVDPGVEVECALDNSAAVIAGIPGATVQVQGRTPMESGLTEGITYLQGLPADEPRVVLFVADGGINCSEDFDATVDLVSTAAAAEIPTYVIGIDPTDDDTFDQLTALANAGGRPRPNGPPDFYPVQNQAELDDAMTGIISDSLSCTVTIDPEPDYPDFFEVWVGMNQVPEITDCASESGWRWVTPYSEIEFCGQACIDLNTEGSMEGHYFCPPQ